LFWDDTNNRLGIGTNAPATALQVVGNISTFNANASRGINMGIAVNDLSNYINSGQGTGFFMHFQDGNPSYEPIRVRMSIGTFGVGFGNFVAAGNAIGATAHVRGSGSTSATTSLLVQNSGGRTALKVADNGVVTIGADDKSGEQLVFVGLFGTRLRILTNSVIDGITGSVINSALDFTSNDLILSSKAASTTSNVYIIPTSFTSLSGSVLVNTTTDVASSVLTVNSTTKGFLPPRMTTTQRDAIVTPATGLKIYNTTLGTTDTYDGATWQRFGQQTFIKGSGSTSATTSLLIQNSAGTTLMSVSDNGNISMGAGSLTTFTGTVANTTGPMQALSFFTTNTPFNFGTASIYNITGTTPVVTSGQRDGFLGQFTFAPTSGTAVLNVLNVSPTINQTGGANGITRGLYINPTLTAAADFRAIEVTDGNVLIGNSASNTAKLSIKGSGTTSGTTSLLVQNSAGTQTFKVEDGGLVQIGLTSFINWTFNSNTLTSSQFAYIKSSNGSVLTTGAVNGGVHGNDNGGKVADSGINIPQVASAVLEVSSTTRGFLPPRMTTAEKNLIATPATGLMVFDTDLARPCFFNGATWITL
jgi:hypothetical protein